MADSKVWFITGSSKGFGRIWAEAALERGDKVAATARDAVDARAADREVRRRACWRWRSTSRTTTPTSPRSSRPHEKFGRLDVVVNNAGYGLFGAVEEVSEEQARDQIETNLFGALWVTQAALPIMREQGSGHIIQVSSIGGVTAFPEVGLYHASKWGLEAFSQSLSLEVADFGIKVTLVEPQGFSTDWSGPSAIRAEQMPAYERDARGAQETARRAADAGRPGGDRPGDPQAGRRGGAAAALLLRRQRLRHRAARLREPDRELGRVGLARQGGARRGELEPRRCALRARRRSADRGLEHRGGARHPRFVGMDRGRRVRSGSAVRPSGSELDLQASWPTLAAYQLTIVAPFSDGLRSPASS